MMKWLELDNVSIAYAQREVVRGCSFIIPKGEILSLLGPSGCGKSTILKAIAGLLPVTQGEIYLNEQLMSSADTMIAPQGRQVGMIFQDYALFPHMTVAENVAFGLHNIDKHKRQERVLAMLDMVRLADYAARYPHALSGGQQQRVAIARAMAREPHLMLLDEPFSNLDNEVREQLMSEMKQLFRRHGMSAVFVTHNKAEAFALADQVAVMGDGIIAQIASPRELYDHPADEQIAAFLGHGSVVRFRKNGDEWQCGAGILPSNKLAEIMVQYEDERSADVFLRPHQLLLAADTEKGNALIERAQFLGDFSIYHVALPEQTVQVVCKNRLAPGDRARLTLRV
ncbi:ABC transporter ATP-binding protein [Cardiobacteriaceae bacterium TAE3-ERU3]|nr:ABC transporter ATP-binding protein [Cardiobacteriaceae bacterium TAE3-ERU3]